MNNSHPNLTVMIGVVAIGTLAATVATVLVLGLANVRDGTAAAGAA